MKTVRKSADRVAHIFAVKQRIAKNRYFVAQKELIEARDLYERLKNLAMEMSEVVDCADAKSLSARLEFSQRFAQLACHKDGQIEISKQSLSDVKISWLNAARQYDLAVSHYQLAKIEDEQTKDAMMAWRRAPVSFTDGEFIL